MSPIIVLIISIVGIMAGYGLRFATVSAKNRAAEAANEKARAKAKEKAADIIMAAEAKGENLIKEAKAEAKELKKDLKHLEERLEKREETMDKRQDKLDSESEMLREKITKVEAIQTKIKALKESQEQKLADIAKLSIDEAKAALEKTLSDRYAEDLKVRLHKLETGNQTALEDRAKDIITTAMQRLASPTAQELTTTAVSIPSDDMKGKIIGKEGRNIRTFERVSGVELIIDDVPETIVISCFDPVRRQVAKMALENLILDGRIQPAKIEEAVTEAKKTIDGIIRKKGEAAVHEVGILDLDPRIVNILGRLYFRTSYGQQVLQHSIEMAHIAGMIAEEIGADVRIAKAGALVHDIGKALDHDMQGGHVEIGMRILEKFGADPRIITAMKSHHDDWPHETPEAVIVQVADMISGGRPGARRDTVEQYLKRLKELENVAKSYDGVQKAYALSAGREVRIFVHPAYVNDLQARHMARDIAKRIESELRYPGEIKITLIRENRVIEFAR